MSKQASKQEKDLKSIVKVAIFEQVVFCDVIDNAARGQQATDGQAFLPRITPAAKLSVGQSQSHIRCATH